MPLHRRLPKRGFKNIFKTEYATINLKDLDTFSESVITPEIILEKGLIKNIKDGLKILGDGEVKRPLTIKAHAFSASAKDKVVKSGGTIEKISQKT
jgi:large subunit ribosomal protein L15